MHRELIPGVVANVSPTASPETLVALTEMARLATKRTSADLIADHFGYRVLRDEALLPGDTMIHDGQMSVVLRKLAPTSNA